MLDRFFKESFIYAIPTIISRGLGFFLLPFYTRILEPADYGILDLFTVFGSFVNLTVAMQITQGIARYYADDNNVQNKVLYASTAFWFTLICYFIFAAFSLFNSIELAKIVTGAIGHERSFCILIIFHTVNGFFYLIQNQFRWELRSQLYCLISIIYSVTTAIFSILFTFTFKLGLEGILSGMLVGSFIATTIGLWYLKDSFKLKFSSICLKEMLSFSMPLVPSGVAVFLSLYVDRMMLSYFFSLNEVGLYSIGYKLASISGLVLVGFRGAMMPLVYKHYQEDTTPEKLATIFRYFMTYSMLIFLGLTLFSKEVLLLLTTKEYYPAATLVIYLVPSILFSQMYIFTPGMGIAKKTKYILFINLYGVVINIYLNWIFIPSLETVGAALATFIGNFCIFSFYMILSQKLYYIPHQWKPIVLCSLLIYVLAILGTTSILGELPITGSVLVKLLLVLCAIGIIFITGMINKEETKRGTRILLRRFL